MSSLEFALARELEPQPTLVYRFASPCPMHPAGDPARIDFRTEGWEGQRCQYQKKHRCVPIWRISFLCDSMSTVVQEFYCDKFLPPQLRAIVRQ